jgi:hypothetical protein
VNFSTASLYAIMKFIDFVKTNPWKLKILNQKREDLVSIYGHPTDRGAGKLDLLLFKYGNVEIGFDEDGIAFYVQVDFLSSRNTLIGIFTQGLEEIHGNMKIGVLVRLLEENECKYSVGQPKYNPDMEEVVTSSNLIFTFAKPGAEFSGNGLLNIRTHI